MSTSKRDEQTEQVIDKTIDETKESTKKILREVGRSLPEVTATFYDYQEQNLQTIRDMTKDFLESQKELTKSMKLAAWPGTNNVYTLMFYPWVHPEIVADTYVKSVSNFADTCVSAARLSSQLMQLGFESTRNSMEMARNNARHISTYVIQSAQTMQESATQEKKQPGR